MKRELADCKTSVNIEKIKGASRLLKQNKFSSGIHTHGDWLGPASWENLKPLDGSLVLLIGTKNHISFIKSYGSHIYH